MSETLIIRPNSYADTATSYATTEDLANAYDADTSTYATFATQTVTASYAYTYYVFSLSSIPQDAEVTDITLKAKVSATNIDTVNKRYCRLGLYNGTTSITVTKIEVTSSTASVLTSAFTSAEISSFLTASNPRVRAIVSSPRKTTKIVTAHLYDVYLEVTYEPPLGVKNKVKVNGSWVEAEPYVKVNGTWEKATNAFVKVNGNWEEVT